MPNNFAILILSCDKYSDLWSPFIQQFRKFFPTQGITIYLGSNLIPFNESGVTSVLSGPDSDWSTSLIKILEQIPHEKLFVILEDCFLSTPVDIDLLDSVSGLLLKKSTLHIKYSGAPAPDTPTDDPNIGVYERGAPYRATVCGFWDRKYLLSLLIKGESPWNFEILGSYRTSYSDGFYGLTRPLCKYRNMIEKGHWVPESVVWASRNGLRLALGKRRLLNTRSRTLSKLQAAYFDLMLIIPWHWRVRIMNRLRRILISY